MSGTLDPRYAMPFHPQQPDMGAALDYAQKAWQLQQAAGQQNALKAILGAPDAIDQKTGMPTRNALMNLWGVAPDAAMKMADFMTKSGVTQSNLLKSQSDQLFNAEQVAARARNAVFEQTGDPVKADAAAQAAWTEQMKTLRQLMPDAPQQFNYTTMGAGTLPASETQQKNENQLVMDPSNPNAPPKIVSYPKTGRIEPAAIKTTSIPGLSGPIEKVGTGGRGGGKESEAAHTREMLEPIVRDDFAKPVDQGGMGHSFDPKNPTDVVEYNKRLLAAQAKQRLASSPFMQGQAVATRQHMDKWLTDHPDATSEEYGTERKTFEGTIPAKQTLTREEIIKVGSAGEKIRNANSTITDMLNLMNKNPAIATMLGRPLRAGETFANITGLMDSTDRATFDRLLQQLRVNAVPLLTQGTPGAQPSVRSESEALKLIPGEQWGSSTQSVKDALLSLRNQFGRDLQTMARTSKAREAFPWMTDDQWQRLTAGQQAAPASTEQQPAQKVIRYDSQGRRIQQ